jgi:GT2 family glycosyltransferase
MKEVRCPKGIRLFANNGYLYFKRPHPTRNHAIACGNHIGSAQQRCVAIAVHIVSPHCCPSYGVFPHLVGKRVYEGFMPRRGAVGFSVIICTRNRASQLQRCLQKFNELQTICESWELIVVDNNSSDDTKAVVQKFIASASVKVSYVLEYRKGLSYARNRGVAEASGSIIAFTDDDCFIDAHWAGTIVREFAADPSLAVLGGRVEQADQDAPPVGVRAFSDRKRISSFDELFGRMIGCNMAFSRQVFEVIGGFDPLLGKGTVSGSAEDLDLLYRAFKMSLNMVYVPEAVVFHAHGRTSMSSLQRVHDEYAKGRGGFYCKHMVRGDFDIAKRAGREILDLARASLSRTNAHVARPSPPRVLRNLAMGALFRLIGG